MEDSNEDLKNFKQPNIDPNNLASNPRKLTDEDEEEVNRLIGKSSKNTEITEFNDIKELDKDTISSSKKKCIKKISTKESPHVFIDPAKIQRMIKMKTKINLMII